MTLIRGHGESEREGRERETAAKIGYVGDAIETMLAF